MGLGHAIVETSRRARARDRASVLLETVRTEVGAAVASVTGASGLVDCRFPHVDPDGRPGYDRQRPAPFGVALRAAKAALDPAGILDPGVLIDPV